MDFVIGMMGEKAYNNITEVLPTEDDMEPIKENNAPDSQNGSSGLGDTSAKSVASGKT